MEAKGTRAAAGVKESAEAELQAAREAELLASSMVNKIDDARSQREFIVGQKVAWLGDSGRARRDATITAMHAGGELCDIEHDEHIKQPINVKQSIRSLENNGIWALSELRSWMDSADFETDNTHIYNSEELAEVMRGFSNAHVERLSLSEFIVMVVYAKQEGKGGRVPVSGVEARIAASYFAWDEELVRAHDQKCEQEQQRQKASDASCAMWLKICILARSLVCLLACIFCVHLGKCTQERVAAPGHSIEGSSPVSRWLARIDPKDWFCCKIVAGRIDYAPSGNAGGVSV